MSEELSAVETQQAMQDMGVFIQHINAFISSQDQPGHMAYPSLNVIAMNFADVVQQNVIMVMPDGMQNITREFFRAMIAMHTMTREGHLILEMPCTYAHPERNN